MGAQHILCLAMKSIFPFTACSLWLLFAGPLSLPANVRAGDAQENMMHNDTTLDAMRSGNYSNPDSNGTIISGNQTYPKQLCGNKQATTGSSLSSLSIEQAIVEMGINEHEHECDSLDIRNDCHELLRLTGCTVIRGFLIVVLLPKHDVTTSDFGNSEFPSNSSNVNVKPFNDTCDYDLYQFPLLREITEYVLFYDVKGLRSFKRLLPNLTVIRGRKLFLHYALSIYSLPDLERLEFPSLLAIQYGEVFISSTPKLCEIDQINWRNLTTAPDENYILPINIIANETCPSTQREHCNHCRANSCWSSDVCQLFEEDIGKSSLVNTTVEHSHCREDCIGGCRNGTQDCVVCRHLTVQGKCVKTCPPNTYLVEHFQRCLTHAECAEIKYYVNYTNCLQTCPNGFMMNSTTYECIKCSPSDKCIKVCQAADIVSKLFMISTLHDAEFIQGCHTLNGTLMIVIRNTIDETKLQQRLSDLREVNGHVKIADCPYLTSLSFLSGLRRIGGKPLENDVYSLIIYGNTRLRRLWPVADGQDGLDLGAGGMYVHRNHLLCNKELYEFRERVLHNRTRDSLQGNDEAVLCAPHLINAHLQALSNTALSISWRKNETAAQVRIFWREVALNLNDTEVRRLSEEDDEEICTRGYWERREPQLSTLGDNGTHYNYTIMPLQAYTRYVVVLKTFGTAANLNGSVHDSTLHDVQVEANSALLLAITKADIPTPPDLRVLDKTNTSLRLQLLPRNRTYEGVTHYKIYVYELPEAAAVQNRNYCYDGPLYVDDTKHNSTRNEDYVDCCTRRAEEVEDVAFVDGVNADFGCTSARPRNCNENGTSVMLPRWNSSDAKLLTSWVMPGLTYNLSSLRSYQQYALLVQACTITVCGSYSLHSERTNYTADADHVVNMSACWSASMQRYYVRFNEPTHPNGLVLYYMLHLYSAPNGERQVHAQCITRQQHVANHNRYSFKRLNYTFIGVAVRIYSLASNAWSPTVLFDVCSNEDIYGDVPLKIAGSVHHGVNVFLVCFLLGAGGTLVWVCYKRRYWRKCIELRNLLPYTRLSDWHTLVPQQRDHADTEDRMVLVDGFETVRFHNSDDDENKYLE